MDLIPDFIKRKQGKIPIAYEMPELEPILKDTYGVIVYQEQVMAIANKVAGFRWDKRTFSAAPWEKKPEKWKSSGSNFGRRQQKNRGEKSRQTVRADPEIRRLWFQQITRRRLRRGLLPHRLPEGALSDGIHGVPHDHRHGQRRQIVGYFTECRGSRIPVLPPDVNQSQKDFAVVDKSIRFGFNHQECRRRRRRGGHRVAHGRRPVPLVLRSIPPRRSPQN